MTTLPLLHHKYYQCTQIENTGFKPDLLILHGLFGAGSNWHNIAENLTVDRNVYTVDLRNHGNSFWNDSMSYADMAADVAQLIDHLNLSSCVVMGHSMGGKVAMQLTQLLPEAIERCIVVDITPRLYPAHHQDILAALRAVKDAKIQTRSEAQRAMTPLIKDFRVIAFLLKSFQANQGSEPFLFNIDVIAKQYSQIADSPTVSPDKYCAPILFIRGELSSYIQIPEDEILIHSLYRNASISPISGAGHWVHAEQKEIFVKAVHKFLL